ncbi:putative L-fuculose-phosphate aldolase [Hyaloraphidium curvatum]|nr:putative L-fuculose-phosphate aldolase [Hyaloraphidium curvatum]
MPSGTETTETATATAGSVKLAAESAPASPGSSLSAAARARASQHVEAAHRTPRFIPRRPSFSTVEEERFFRKAQLAAAFRWWGELGWDMGIAGHATVRDPEFPDCFWMNPLAVAFTEMRAGDLLLINQAGEVIHGNRPMNAAGFAIHAGIFRTRPEIVSILHCHSPKGKAFSSLPPHAGQTVRERVLEPINQDACGFYERQAVHEVYSGVVLAAEEGEELGRLLEGGTRLVILRNHGFLAAGASVADMCWWYYSAEENAGVQMMAEAAAAGASLRESWLPHDVAVRTRDGSSSTVLGAWFFFQPTYEYIVRKYPDVLEDTERPVEPHLVGGKYI